MPKYLLFDLDGTIIDPCFGITNAVMYALRAMGIEVPKKEELFSFIGPPLHESFKTAYGFDDKEVERAIKLYREYYTSKGISENTLYEGIEDVFAKAKENGNELFIATSKPSVFAKKIIKEFNIDKYFTFIGGSELSGERNEKHEVISYVLDQNSINITNKEDIVMIGDRKYDILGAKKVGISSVGVLYGYGSREELEEAGAGAIVATVSDLLAIV